MRLIDADKVIEVIKEMQKAYPIEDQRPHAKGMRVALFDCRKLIEDQPTAYDVDNVCEELHHCGAFEVDWEERVATKIVKRGGVDG